MGWVSLQASVRWMDSTAEANDVWWSKALVLLVSCLGEDLSSVGQKNTIEVTSYDVREVRFFKEMSSKTAEEFFARIVRGIYIGDE